MLLKCRQRMCGHNTYPHTHTHTVLVGAVGGWVGCLAGFYIYILSIRMYMVSKKKKENNFWSAYVRAASETTSDTFVECATTNDTLPAHNLYRGVLRLCDECGQILRSPSYKHTPYKHIYTHMRYMYVCVTTFLHSSFFVFVAYWIIYTNLYIFIC